MPSSGTSTGRWSGGSPNLTATEVLARNRRAYIDIETYSYQVELQSVMNEVYQAQYRARLDLYAALVYGTAGRDNSIGPYPPRGTNP
jgi:hypothetical protein